MPPQRFSQNSINVLQRRSVGPHWQPRGSHRDIDNTLRFLLNFRKENHCKNERLERRRCLHNTLIANLCQSLSHSQSPTQLQDTQCQNQTVHAILRYTVLTSKSSCRGFLNRLKQVCFFIKTIDSHSIQRVGNHRRTRCPFLLEEGFKVRHPLHKRTDHSLQDIFKWTIYPFFGPLS